VRLTGKERGVQYRTYVLASDYSFALNRETFDRLERDPAWRTVVIDAGHDLMIEAPEQLTRVLLQETER
jgi:hypothetical protein